MTCIVVVNPASGSVPENAVDLIETELAPLNISYDIQTGSSDTLQDTLSRAHETLSANDTLAIWSGDGSLACALELQRDNSPPILALPGGTMNMLHKRIHGDVTDWPAVLKNCLENRNELELASGLISGHRFYVGALFGKLTQLARAREIGRQGQPLKAVGEVLNTTDLLDLTPELVITSEDGNEFQANTMGVFVEDTVPDAFEAGIFSSISVLDLTTAALEALFMDWRIADGVDHIITRTLNVSCDTDHPIHVTLDGEPYDLECPLKLEFQPRSARVLTARQ